MVWWMKPQCLLHTCVMSHGLLVSVGETTFCCSASLQWLSILSKCNTQYKLSDLMIIWSRKHGTFFAKTTSKVHASSMNKYFCKRIYVAPITRQKQGAFYVWGKIYMNWFQCWIMTSIVYVESESGRYPMAQTSTESHESFCYPGNDDVVHDQRLPKYITPPSSSGPSTNARAAAVVQW